MLVEFSKPVLGKRRRRAQLTGAERRQRPPRRPNILCDLRKSLRQRQQTIKTHALDLKAGRSRSAARILKHRRDEPVIAGWKIARHAWCSVDGFIPFPCGPPSRHCATASS